MREFLAVFAILITASAAFAEEPAAAAVAATSPSQVAAAEKTLSEDQIPVLKEKEKPAEVAEKTSAHKAVVALTIVLLMVGGLALTAKRWLQKTGVSNKHTNIRVITQHYLGSKKNLTVVSVAGEYILLGVTDHNINLIKTLSLMDDEIPESDKKPFNAALDASLEQTDFVEIKHASPSPASAEAEEGFSIRHLKEAVNKKLRGMKELS
jgi:flagellar protein FliO/FliZ